MVLLWVFLYVKKYVLNMFVLYLYVVEDPLENEMSSSQGVISNKIILASVIKEPKLPCDMTILVSSANSMGNAESDIHARSFTYR